MATQPHIGGVKHVYFEGIELRVDEEGIKYMLDTHEREFVPAVGGVAGVKTKRKVPFVEMTVIDTSDLDVAALMASRGTITLHLENGKTIGLRGSMFTGSGEVEADTGRIAGRWEGESAFEIL